MPSRWSASSASPARYTCRPDLAGFVNGLPLVVIKLKKPGVPARAAFDENLTHYKAEIPHLFWFNALLRVWPMASIACRATGGGCR